MANPICLSPLKFYDALWKQNHRKSYAYGHISPLIMPLNILDPFQFVLNNNLDQIIDASLFRASDDTEAELETSLLSILEDAGLDYVEVGSYKIVTFPGIFPLTGIDYEGEYYIKFETNEGEDTYYSEVFCFTNNLGDCLTIEYWNPESDF